jgi:hypothetical protein
MKHPSKFYIAGRYGRREELLEESKKLESAGYICTSRWLHGEEEGKTREAIALLDWEDVVKADGVILYTEPYGSANKGGGRHTEFGMGYALKKHCYYIGENEQVFCSLPGVKQFKSIEDVILHLDQ